MPEQGMPALQLREQRSFSILDRSDDVTGRQSLSGVGGTEAGKLHALDLTKPLFLKFVNCMFH
jgi:hypothetical protein